MRSLTKAKESFDRYEFLKGVGVLNNFITNELSGIYMDICKDRLYCENVDSEIRRASQSAMALIASRMMVLFAPILTYTVDEIVEYAPKVIKGDKEDVFDLIYENIPSVETPFDDRVLIKAREAFNEEVDRLKKSKLIGSTLEVDVVGSVDSLVSKRVKIWKIGLWLVV